MSQLKIGIFCHMNFCQNRKRPPGHCFFSLPSMAVFPGGFFIFVEHHQNWEWSKARRGWLARWHSYSLCQNWFFFAFLLSRTSYFHAESEFWSKKQPNLTIPILRNPIWIFLRNTACAAFVSLLTLIHTVWTVNDVLVDPYPFIILVNPHPFRAIKGYGSTEMIKWYGLTKTSLSVHAVYPKAMS